MTLRSASSIFVDFTEPLENRSETAHAAGSRVVAQKPVLLYHTNAGQQYLDIDTQGALGYTVCCNFQPALL